MAQGGCLADTVLIRYKCRRSSSQVTYLPHVGRGSLSSGDRAKNSAPGSSCNSACAPLPSLSLPLLHPLPSSPPQLLFTLLSISVQILLFWNLFLFFLPPQPGKRRLNKSRLILTEGSACWVSHPDDTEDRGHDKAELVTPLSAMA